MRWLTPGAPAVLSTRRRVYPSCGYQGRVTGPGWCVASRWQSNTVRQSRGRQQGVALSVRRRDAVVYIGGVIFGTSLPSRRVRAPSRRRRPSAVQRRPPLRPPPPLSVCQTNTAAMPPQASHSTTNRRRRGAAPSAPSTASSSKHNISKLGSPHPSVRNAHAGIRIRIHVVVPRLDVAASASSDPANGRARRRLWRRRGAAAAPGLPLGGAKMRRLVSVGYARVGGGRACQLPARCRYTQRPPPTQRYASSTRLRIGLAPTTVHTSVRCWSGRALAYCIDLGGGCSARRGAGLPARWQAVSQLPTVARF